MKYVVARNRVTEQYHVAVFDEAVVHANVKTAIGWSVPATDVLSAGFVHLVDGKWVVSPEGSGSLKLGPRAVDEIILNLFLGQGLTGLDLSNVLTYLAIQSVKEV